VGDRSGLGEFITFFLLEGFNLGLEPSAGTEFTPSTDFCPNLNATTPLMSATINMIASSTML
jgi:hypothetical protein